VGLPLLAVIIGNRIRKAVCKTVVVSFLLLSGISESSENSPSDLLVLPLPRLDLQTALVHLMHVPSRLHVTQNVLL